LRPRQNGIRCELGIGCGVEDHLMEWPGNLGLENLIRFLSTERTLV